MISVQKCQFLAISEDWTNVYACCLFKLYINNECLVYIHSLDFALIIYVTKIRQFHVSQFWHEPGPISPFVVLALSFRYTSKKGVSLHLNLNPLHLKCFVPSLVEIGPVVLEKKTEMWKIYADHHNNNNDGQLSNFDQRDSLEPSAQVS